MTSAILILSVTVLFYLYSICSSFILIVSYILFFLLLPNILIMISFMLFMQYEFIKSIIIIISWLLVIPFEVRLTSVPLALAYHSA